jgi:4-diphosphocytidyl-2-C-methyl-D-erythritol kinase
MHLESYGARVAVWAPAKVNLYLEILGKRADGYHELATLLVAVRLFDTLLLASAPSEDIRLECSDPTLACGPDNLVVRAAALLRQHTGCRQGAAMRLVKRIPRQAGLGGGSADAAATLAGLNRLWRLGLRPDELMALGARLGSDVPFFFHGPAAWCTGRGEQVEPLRLGRPLDLVVVCPTEGLSTAEVYRNIGQASSLPQSQTAGWKDAGDLPRQALERSLATGEIDELGRLLFNRLQPVAEGLCPKIAIWRQRLAALQPAGQLMSGSGSSLFALCRDENEARRIVQGIVQGLHHGPDEERRVFRVRSCF